MVLTGCSLCPAAPRTSSQSPGPLSPLRRDSPTHSFLLPSTPPPHRPSSSPSSLYPPSLSWLQLPSSEHNRQRFCRCCRSCFSFQCQSSAGLLTRRLVAFFFYQHQQQQRQRHHHHHYHHHHHHHHHHTSSSLSTNESVATSEVESTDRYLHLVFNIIIIAINIIITIIITTTKFRTFSLSQVSPTVQNSSVKILLSYDVI